MAARKPSRIALAILLVSLGISCACPLARGGHAVDAHMASVILWVQEIHGQALYWVNDKPCGRAPLSGLVAETGSNRSIALAVILDSRVPIQEVAEVEGLLAKMDFRNVHYYVFNHAYPSIGMSEIIWKAQSVPLPAAPPAAAKLLK